MRLLHRAATHLGRASHRAACRNALAASTALAQRARERHEVEDYLATLQSGRGAAVREPAGLRRRAG